ncbi:MAG: response regulator transcription factor [Chloroflexota bacterium]
MVRELPPEIKQIFVVEDDTLLLKAIEKLLADEGFDVKTAVSGEEALRFVKRHGLPHLMVVDLNLPKMDGFEFVRTVQQFSDVPAIMVTAVDEVATIATGLNDCLEDYIVKPFRSSELLSRINRVLRRVDNFGYINDPIIFIDIDLQIDLPNRTAYLDEKAVSLSPTETKLLHILMNHAERTVSYDFLLRRIWPREKAVEERLHTNVYRLRKKLEQNPKQPKYIRSNWGMGYMFCWGNSG